uniref:Uncharacterized protein n=1 Tax=Meloidogyne enterolobii TaxID=390850 RepID=A0A6V7XVR1_MELEN|nr:unnamed protein product [Meloidogyne enterolobii]
MNLRNNVHAFLLRMKCLMNIWRLVREGLDLANLPFLERVLVIRDKTNDRRQQRRRKAQILNNNNNNLTRASDVVAVTHGQEQQEEQHSLLSPRTSSLSGPWWLSPWAFWPASIILLSWPLRMLAEYKTGYVHLQVCKLFGTNYLRQLLSYYICS